MLATQKHEDEISNYSEFNQSTIIAQALLNNSIHNPLINRLSYDKSVMKKAFGGFS